MRPIILFVFAAIAASAIGAASLTNVIDLNVQQFGVGSEDIVSPIDSASVDFEIEAIQGENELKNMITACSFHSEDSIEVGPATIICKLTDENSKVIAEGRLTVPAYAASDRLLVPITQTAYDGANLVNNVHDVTLVVIGSDPTIVEGPPPG